VFAAYLVPNYGRDLVLKTYFSLTTAILLIASSASAANIEPVVVAPNIPYAMGAETAAQVLNTGCRWQERFMTQLVQNTKEKTFVSPTAEGATGHKLSIAAYHSTKNTPANESSPRWLELSGKLTEKEKVIGEFSFLRETYSGSLKDCNTLNDLADDLADDLAQWLENPASGIKIEAVMPALKENTIDPVVQSTCPLTRKFPEALADASDTTVQRTSQDIKTVQGKKLLLKAVSTRLAGGGAQKGDKWIKIAGSLVEDDREIGSFIALRQTARARESCDIVKSLSSEISDDILKWLKNPTANAKLGDADETTTAEP
jgi:hypothetical protein